LLFGGHFQELTDKILYNYSLGLQFLVFKDKKADRFI